MSVAVAPKTAQEYYKEGYRLKLLPKGGESSSYYQLAHPDGSTTELRDNWDPPGLFTMTVSVVDGKNELPFDCQDYDQAINILYPLERLTKSGQ